MCGHIIMGEEDTPPGSSEVRTFALSGTPRHIVSCDDHEHNSDSREHQTEGKHRQILHSEQEDTENNTCNGNQR